MGTLSGEVEGVVCQVEWVVWSGGGMGTLSGEVEGVVCQVEWVLCQEGAWVLCQVRWRGWFVKWSG